MVSSRNDIKKGLLKIDTGFKDKDGKKAGVDYFASFLTIKGKFPSKDEVKEKYGTKDFFPSDIRNDFKNGLPNDDSFAFPDDFFDNPDFKNEYMFVGLNGAYRPEKLTDYHNWGNFRDTINFQNTYKLYAAVNDSKFNGCYITDIVKGLINSKASEVKKNLYQPENKEILNNSTRTFIEECFVIRPKNLIIFGGAAEGVFKKMVGSKLFRDSVKEISDKYVNDNFNIIDLVEHRAFEVAHYSSYPKFKDWFLNESDRILEKISEKDHIEIKRSNK